MKNSIVLFLALFFVNSFANAPMESLDKTIFVFVHGLADGGDDLYECYENGLIGFKNPADSDGGGIHTGSFGVYERYFDQSSSKMNYSIGQGVAQWFPTEWVGSRIGFTADSNDLKDTLNSYWSHFPESV